jgi:hypothetical protein
MACSCQNAGSDSRSIVARMAGVFQTLRGQLVPGPLYSDQIAPAYPQPHRDRDGVPWTGLLPTIRINAPARPQLELDPVTATTWYLRAMPHVVPAPMRVTQVPISKKLQWMGRSG